MSLTSVGEAMGWFNKTRLSLTQLSSRRIIGRPVPKLILWVIVSSEQNVQVPEQRTDGQTNRGTAKS